MQENPSLYHAMLRIRRFEETVLEQFSKGHFYGTTHTCLGQEADAVGVLQHITPHDVVVSNHRGHGHFLAYGGDMRGLFAELMGKASGICGGQGGSQHLHWRNFYSNGILGGTAPLAAGMALVEKLQGRGAVTVCFLGDGALGEGTVYEALNMSALWSLPILFVLENNRIAQSTPIERNLAGTIAGRFAAFGIPATELESSDVMVIAEAAGRALEAARGPSTTVSTAPSSFDVQTSGLPGRTSFAPLRSGSSGAAQAAAEAGGGPQALILNTHRLGPHSKGDDPRPAEEIASLRREFDPLPIHGRRLTEAERAAIEAQVESEVRAAFEAALAEPMPGPESLFNLMGGRVS